MAVTSLPKQRGLSPVNGPIQEGCRRHHGRITRRGRLPPRQQQLLLETFRDVGCGVGRIPDRKELALRAKEVAIERHRHVWLAKTDRGAGTRETVVEGRQPLLE
jgi:hypothetical protein